MQLIVKSAAIVNILRDNIEVFIQNTASMAELLEAYRKGILKDQEGSLVIPEGHRETQNMLNMLEKLPPDTLVTMQDVEVVLLNTPYRINTTDYIRLVEDITTDA